MSVLARSSEELAAVLYAADTPPQSSPATEPAAAQPVTQPTPGASTARTSDELAEAIYGKPKTPPVNSSKEGEAATRRTADELAEAMYGRKPEDQPLAPVPPEVAALRNETARRLYSAQKMNASEIPDNIFAAVTGEGITDESKAAAVREWREIATDVGITGNDLREGINVYKQVASLPADDQSSEKWRAESCKWLNEQYGSQAPQMLALAQKLVSRDPRVQNLIRANGRFGDHPKIIQVVVQAAIRERGAGRL